MWSGALLARLATMLEDLGSIPAQGGSSHLPFYDNGLPSLLFWLVLIIRSLLCQKGTPPPWNSPNFLHHGPPTQNFWKSIPKPHSPPKIFYLCSSTFKFLNRSTVSDAKTKLDNWVNWDEDKLFLPLWCSVQIPGHIF